MKISEMIVKLSNLKNKHGDLPVGVLVTELSGGGGWTEIDMDTEIEEAKIVEFVKANKFAGFYYLDKTDHIEIKAKD